MRITLVCLLCLNSLLTGCSHPFARVESPSVSVSQIHLVEAHVLEQRYLLRLRLQNPNSFALPISGMQYRLFINGAEFAHGVSSQAVHVPAYGERLVEVEMVSTLGALMNQLRRWPPGPEDTLRYRLAGEAGLATRFRPVHFEYHGVFPFATPIVTP